MAAKGKGRNTRAATAPVAPQAPIEAGTDQAGAPVIVDTNNFNVIESEIPRTVISEGRENEGSPMGQTVQIENVRASFLETADQVKGVGLNGWATYRRGKGGRMTKVINFRRFICTLETYRAAGGR